MIAHLASTTDAGPLLRTLHPIHTARGTWFHGRASGEKARALGRPAVISSEEIVARIPSYVFDPDRACPATTWFVATELRGVLESLEDPVEKAAVLQAMMEAYQPEGGHVPISADDPRYRQSVAKLLIFGIRGEATRRVKIGQDKPVATRHRVLEWLWAQGDCRAIDRIRELDPALPDPPFLAAPARIRVAPQRLVPGVGDAYWNLGLPPDRLLEAHRRASAWVVAEIEGRVVASARAMADGTKNAWIYDVFVVEGQRGRGLGDRLLRLLLDHAAVRDCARVFLRTRDAQPFYARHGFVPAHAARRRPYPSEEMVLERPRPIGPLAGTP